MARPPSSCHASDAPNDESGNRPAGRVGRGQHRCIHGSRGRRNRPAQICSRRPAIIAGIAKATLAPNPQCRWDGWVGDYERVRDAIGATYPGHVPRLQRAHVGAGRLLRGNSARESIWKTASGKAKFITPEHTSATEIDDAPGRYRLMTMRSNDQFNTTIYGLSDRLRGIDGARDVLLINPDGIRRAGLTEGEIVSLVSDAGDGVERRVDGLKVTPFSLPDGCIGGYYPEMNPLMPLWSHDEESKTPAAKSFRCKFERAATTHRRRANAVSVIAITLPQERAVITDHTPMTPAGEVEPHWGSAGSRD